PEVRPGSCPVRRPVRPPGRSSVLQESRQQPRQGGARTWQRLVRPERARGDEPGLLWKPNGKGAPEGAGVAASWPVWLKIIPQGPLSSGRLTAPPRGRAGEGPDATMTNRTTDLIGAALATDNSRNEQGTADEPPPPTRERESVPDTPEVHQKEARHVP